MLALVDDASLLLLTRSMLLITDNLTFFVT